MKKTAIQQAIAKVRNRMESQNETLMGKHTAHHLQQVERELYDLLGQEKEDIMEAYLSGESDGEHYEDSAQLYYNETYK